MFAPPKTRPDSTDTRQSDSAWALSGFSRHETHDAAELMDSSDAADLHLMRLVVYAAAATLLLALAARLGA